MAFKVKTHHWIDGVLEALEHEFVHEFEAMFFAKSAKVHHVKVYNESGEVIHTNTDETNSTYA
jgi:hypothetical protein